ncbi:hypothetical protein INR49_014117 [Caranx melampygus]|nr:hypothetical protein INR49_014117 [Caranx melampygus]
MLMPKKNRIAIYELLFKEGVMVAKKDVHLAKHPELADKNVPNLHVMKAMQSLKSCGYVKEQFAWRHFYWYLTNEGIQYLRDFLHLPPEIVPATLRRQTRPETARPRPKGMEGERPARLNRGEADRDAYRRSAAPRTYTSATPFTPGCGLVLCARLVLTRKQRPVLELPQTSSLGVASDAAEDSSLSKFHYLFVYNKEKSKYSLNVLREQEKQQERQERKQEGKQEKKERKQEEKQEKKERKQGGKREKKERKQEGKREKQERKQGENRRRRSESRGKTGEEGAKAGGKTGEEGEKAGGKTGEAGEKAGGKTGESGEKAGEEELESSTVRQVVQREMESSACKKEEERELELSVIRQMGEFTERAGEAAEKAGEAGEKAREAGEKAGEKAGEEAGEKAGEAAEEAGEKAGEEAGEKAGEAAEAAAGKGGGATGDAAKKGGESKCGTVSPGLWPSILQVVVVVVVVMPTGMLMPKKNRIAIYELLFKEGVMVAKKDVHLAKHPELADKNVPNLHVMKAMQSLKSCGYVKEQFAWRHFYWYLTNEGIQYLRDFLHLPPEIVPATLRRQTRPETARPRPKGMEGERPARLNRGEADRDAYRRSAAPPGADKKAEAGAGAATDFQFRGGFGRGRGQQPQ